MGHWQWCLDGRRLRTISSWKTGPKNMLKSIFVARNTKLLPKELASSLTITVVSGTVSPNDNNFLDEKGENIWLLALNPGGKLRII